VLEQKLSSSQTETEVQLMKLGAEIEASVDKTDTMHWLISHTKYGPAKLKQTNEISRKQ
jgi:hypothetical protein